MSSAVQAVALDYDGTVAHGPRPEPEVLEAVSRVRESGRAVLLVTGRILAELRVDFPDVDQHFDAIIAENGAVLARGGSTRDLAPAVDPRLGLALARHDVPVRHGRVLLACDAVHDRVVLEEVTRLGLDCQIVRNRAALMVLPAGVTKGTGVGEGLAELGISRHSTVGVGDAENDHSLLEACEIAVAVNDAVPALKDHADLVLAAANGHGVRELLDGPVLKGRQRVHSPRWQVELGTDATGAPVRIPANQLNVLIIGGSGGGKSYAAGLFAEQVVDLGYTVLVMDATGEHRELGELRGVLTLGGNGEPLPPPDRIGDLVSHRFGSVVLDLSLLPGPARWGYVGDVASRLSTHRARTGLPHWVVIEEAHAAAGVGGFARPMLRPGGPNHCLVTYHPLELCDSVTAGIDVVVATAGEGAGHDQAVAFLSAFTGLGSQPVSEAIAGCAMGEALLVGRRSLHELVPVVLAARQVRHVRHQHKYALAELPRHLRFYFSSDDGSPGPVAGNIGQFQDVLAACDPRVIAYHAGRGDFSRWVREVLSDGPLGDKIARIERDHAADGDREVARHRVLQAVSARYL